MIHHVMLDAVLIDDDPLVRLTWRVAAKKKGKQILTFASTTEFYEQLSLLTQLQELKLNTPIYVDSNLGESVRGEQVCLDLASRGYTEIFLATGYEPSSFGTLEGVKGIVGKYPVL